MADYAAVLKQYVERCEFTEFLEQSLRYRFVCALRKSAIQKKLLTEKKAEEAGSCGRCPELWNLLTRKSLISRIYHGQCDSLVKWSAYKGQE